MDPDEIIKCVSCDISDVFCSVCGFNTCEKHLTECDVVDCRERVCLLCHASVCEICGYSVCVEHSRKTCSIDNCVCWCKEWHPFEINMCEHCKEFFCEAHICLAD